MSYQIVNKNVLNNNTIQIHIIMNNENYVISDNGSETLIFPADSNGKITDWAEVGGSRNTTHNEVLANIQQYMF
jgi:hypothetical protein